MPYNIYKAKGFDHNLLTNSLRLDISQLYSTMAPFKTILATVVALAFAATEVAATIPLGGTCKYFILGALYSSPKHST